MNRSAAFGLLFVWLVCIALLTSCGHRGPLIPPGETPRASAAEQR